MNNTARLKVKSFRANIITDIEFELLNWLKENPCNIFEIKYSSCYDVEGDIFHSVLLFYEKTKNMIMKSSTESETLEFWEKLFKENGTEKTKDKSHYKKTKVILKRLAVLYGEKMGDAEITRSLIVPALKLKYYVEKNS